MSVQKETKINFKKEKKKKRSLKNTQKLILIFPHPFVPSHPCPDHAQLPAQVRAAPPCRQGQLKDTEKDHPHIQLYRDAVHCSHCIPK